MAALRKLGATGETDVLSGKGNDMNGFVTDSSDRQEDEVRLVDSLNRSQLFDSKICHLKVLALSLLREIAAAENTSECEGSNTIDLQAEVRRFETELIRSALIHTGGRQRQAARLLGTKVTTLNTKIKRYGIEISE